MESKIFELGIFNIPKTPFGELYMHPFHLENPILPKNYTNLHLFLKKILYFIPLKTGISYLTIDHKSIIKGETHRRGGKHVDGNYISSEWPKGNVWEELTSGNGYESKTGGALIISDYSSCKGWIGVFEESIGQGGDCSNVDTSTMAEVPFKKNHLYLMNSTAIHESLPVSKTVCRTLIRITLPSICEI